MILEDFFGQVVTFNLSSSYQNFDPTGDIPNTRDFFPKLNTKSRKQHKCATHKNTKVITNSINYVLKIKKANESGNCDSNTQKLFTEYSAKAVFKFCYFNVRNRCGIFSTNYSRKVCRVVLVFWCAVHQYVRQYVPGYYCTIWTSRALRVLGTVV